MTAALHLIIQYSFSIYTAAQLPHLCEVPQLTVIASDQSLNESGCCPSFLPNLRIEFLLSTLKCIRSASFCYNEQIPVPVSVPPSATVKELEVNSVCVLVSPANFFQQSCHFIVVHKSLWPNL